MKNNKSLTVALFSLVFAAQGCATAGVDQKIDQQVSQENAVKKTADLRAEAAQVIQDEAWMSPDQRKSLQQVRENTEDRIEQLDEQSLKLRVVLTKELVAPNYQESEIQEIEQRLRDLEDTKMNLISSAIENGNSILGREKDPDRQEAIMGEMGGSRSRD